jgi:hypothetical protein
MLPQVGEDARLLTLLLEALKGTLEVFIVVDDDFRQDRLPRFGGDCVPLSLQSSVS